MKLSAHIFRNRNKSDVVSFDLDAGILAANMHKWFASFFAIASLFVASVVNAADTNATYIIPDLGSWNKVKVGLPVADVKKLLGEPILGFWTPSEPNAVYSWTYGYVAKKSEIFPEDFAFVLWVQNGKVHLKEDPFGGIPISPDGFPTVPRQMSPADETVFNHYPRFVDFRWYAASGDYPMKYEIEVNIIYPSGEWSRDNEPREVKAPYYTYSHSGANRGRWRVRAINSKGSSRWSEYFYFKFKV
jgi:hypothetical protein